MSRKKSLKPRTIGQRRPFWLPASNYYVLTAAVSLATFFLVWGVLQEGRRDEAPWIAAGVAASVVLGSAVFLREVILRTAQKRFIAAERRLDRNLKHLPLPVEPRRPKLTLEKNAALLREARQRSEAAMVLGHFADGHKAVVEFCQEYLALNERELPLVGPGSPRIAALRKGRDAATGLHRYHLLQWAEIESRALSQAAREATRSAEKVASAKKAVGVIDFALRFYPEESALVESREALRDFAASIKAAVLAEKAERALFKGNYGRAIGHYEDALFELEREHGDNHEKEIAQEHIRGAIARIRELQGNG
jgi:hypothetical protein